MTAETNIENIGILRNDLKVGIVSGVRADSIKVNLAHASDVSGSYLQDTRYGKGEVGDLLLIEGQQDISFGRLTEVVLPEKDRGNISQNYLGKGKLDAVGIVQLLGTIDTQTLKTQAGISHYPRLGDRVFSAPSAFLSLLPSLINDGIQDDSQSAVMLELGEVNGSTSSGFKVTPEKLFGRHCAILGSTGGGKSWTTAKLIEECARHIGSKVIVIDATSEYRSLDDSYTQHHHLGTPIESSSSSSEVLVPPTDFLEDDFIAMFDPAGKVQGPKLREAIRSLRLVNLCPDIFPDGLVYKHNQSKETFNKALKKDGNSKLVDNPSQPFDVSFLTRQIVQECYFPHREKPTEHWGNMDESSVSFCSSLFTRILGVTHSPSFKSVFNTKATISSLGDQLLGFMDCPNKRVFRLCLSAVSYQYYAREIIANVVGRKLMSLAREGNFLNSPVLTILDEAHNFLGRKVGTESHAAKLDAFELIAKEGRKYGLNLCLATQRPRDITEGVLSQMGALLVHRLTNDHDRNTIERACGEIDSSAAAFIPNLKQGEAVILGVDFPIPMTIQINEPINPPESDGACFQKHWSMK